MELKEQIWELYSDSWLFDEEQHIQLEGLLFIFAHYVEFLW